MIIDKIVNTTYGALDQTLLGLGFQTTFKTNEFGLPYVIYENQEYKAVISIPARPQEELMYGGHLVVAEKTVEGQGVADRETFHHLLREASIKTTRAA